jgi:hypothetical protein
MEEIVWGWCFECDQATVDFEAESGGNNTCCAYWDRSDRVSEFVANNPPPSTPSKEDVEKALRRYDSTTWSEIDKLILDCFGNEWHDDMKYNLLKDWADCVGVPMSSYEDWCAENNYTPSLRSETHFKVRTARLTKEQKIGLTIGKKRFHNLRKD